MRGSRSTISVSTPQLREARGDRKPGLAAADDQHGRIAVGVGGGGLAQVEPVGAAEIARIGLALRPRLADLLLVALDLVERGEQRPCLELSPSPASGDEPQHAAAAALRGFEPEDRFDRSVPARVTRRGAVRSGSILKPWAGRPACAFSSLTIASRAVDRADVPGQRQHIAPMAVRMKQLFQRRVARLRERALELRQPALHDCGEIFRPIQHWPFP